MPATMPAHHDDARLPLEVPSVHARSAWDAWGNESRRLPPGAKTILTTLLSGTAHPLPRRSRPTLTASRLGALPLEALRRAVGADHVSTDDAVRVLHLGGKSTTDLLRRRLADPQHAPDAVVAPRDHDEIAAVLAICATEDIAVVPFGGGTSVVGGVDPDGGGLPTVLALDLSRTAALLRFDETSMLATFGAGTTGPQAEEMLAHRGCTIGHFPQSFEFATLGGFAATRSSGQASRGYGRFDELVHALRVASPAGSLDLGRAPASAAGPDLRELILGSEGAFGVISEVTVRVRPRAQATAYAAWLFPDFASGTAALREATQRGIRPTVLRLSDATETRVNAAMGGHLTRLRGCLAIATCEGDDEQSAGTVAAALDAVFRAHGATPRGDDPARSWERGRFDSPALRDTLMDAGVLVETLETAATWSELDAVKRAVTAAITTSLAAEGTDPVVMCHISHVYPAGASLYVTVVASLAAQPIEQWARAKDAATRALIACGATITHHHAVGRDHRPYLVDEIGELGVDVLRAVKRVLDPTGIMNPGVLIGPDEGRAAR